MSTYSLVKQSRESIDFGKYTTYGICVDGKPVADDVSTDEDFVKNLVKDFNVSGLEPVHLHEVLDDIL